MKPSYPNLIRKLLQSKKIMSLKQIRHEIPDRPRSSLFRDLKQVELLTSYSHAGQHHALKSMVKFNPNGLWFYEQIAFSKYGTLKNTLVQIITNSPAGMTHKELKTLLRIQVQNPLTHLIKNVLLQRRLLSDQVFVYLSHNDSQAQEQWQKRLELNEKALGMALPSETIIIDILLEIIRGNERIINEEELNSRLKQRGVNIQQQQLIYVLTYYDIKKNRS
jgi:hypothetical protein